MQRCCWVAIILLACRCGCTLLVGDSYTSNTITPDRFLYIVDTDSLQITAKCNFRSDAGGGYCGGCVDPTTHLVHLLYQKAQGMFSFHSYNMSTCEFTESGDFQLMEYPRLVDVFYDPILKEAVLAVAPPKWASFRPQLWVYRVPLSGSNSTLVLTDQSAIIMVATQAYDVDTHTLFVMNMHFDEQNANCHGPLVVANVETRKKDTYPYTIPYDAGNYTSGGLSYPAIGPNSELLVLQPFKDKNVFQYYYELELWNYAAGTFTPLVPKSPVSTTWPVGAAVDLSNSHYYIYNGNTQLMTYDFKKGTFNCSATVEGIFPAVFLRLFA